MKAVTVTLADGRVFKDSKIMPGDLVALERKYQLRVTQIMGENPVTGKEEFTGAIEHVLFIAYSSVKRKGLIEDLTFDAFVEVVEELNLAMGNDGVEADRPSPPAP